MKITAAVLLLALVSCATTQPLPSIQSFTASPQQVESGKAVELNWSATNYTRLVIDQGVGDVTNLHHITIHPDSVRTYTLLAIGQGGEVTASVRVMVFAY